MKIYVAEGTEEAESESEAEVEEEEYTLFISGDIEMKREMCLRELYKMISNGKIK